MGITVSSSHIVSESPSSAGGGLLTLFPCSRVRSLSWETVLYKLLQCESFPWAAALHELPQVGSFPWGAVLQEKAAPAWVSPQGHKPCQQTCSGMGSSLHGSTGPGSSLFHRGLPKQSQPLSGIHLFQCRVPSMGYSWISAPLWISMDCRRTTCLTTVFIMSCKGRLTAPASQAPPPPSFFTDLGVCRVVSFTLTHSSVFTGFSLQIFFFPCLNMLSQRHYHHC